MRKPAPRLSVALLLTGLALSACAPALSSPEPAVPAPVVPARAVPTLAVPKLAVPAPGVPAPAPVASGQLLSAVFKVGLGKGASLGGRPVFPADNAWNTPIDQAPIDPNSAGLIAAISGNLHPDFGAKWPRGPFGIPYIVVKGSQKLVKVRFAYAGESDRGRYPIPRNAPIEGGSKSKGDRHVIVVDRTHWKLYELYDAHRLKGGKSWRAGSGAVFDLRSNQLRPAGWTSADAAGLPIFPGLVRYDEVRSGIITHALRFTVAKTRRAYVAPARHYASDLTDPNLPPMGMRVRLKADFEISGYPAAARVILTAMKTYGMIVADNGSNWYVSGAPDKRWNDNWLNSLKGVAGDTRNFEVVAMGDVTVG